MSLDLELLYFPLHGRASALHFVMQDNDMKYKDSSAGFWDRFPGNKTEAPFGKFPVLIVDGKTRLSQSPAIMRFLCRHCGLMGSSNLEAALIEMYMDQVHDIRNDFGRMLQTDFEAGAEPFAKSIPTLLEPFEKQLGAGKGDHLINDRLTGADYFLFDILFWFDTFRPGVLDASPRCKAFLAKFKSRPKIRAYLERPEVKEYKFTGSGHF